MRLAAIAAVLIGLAGAVAAQDRPVVVAVNYPLAYFAERLTGDAAEVVLPVPDGADPSFWRPGVADIGAMQKADAVLLNGAGFAGWIAKASLSRARIVETSRDFSDRFIQTETVTHSHGADGAHSHDAVASYVWLDFTLAATQARAVAQGLSRRAPADGMEARLEELTADLAALDTAARDLAPLAQGRLILTSHPRYQYLARAYGLTVDSVDWEAGAAPDDAQLADLAARAEGATAPVFLWEAEPPENARAALAGIGIADMVFPPLAMPPGEGDFITVMHRSIDGLKALLADTGG